MTDCPSMVAVDAVVEDGGFESALDSFRRLGLAVRMVMPADDPAVALLEGASITVRLVRDGALWPTDLEVPPLTATWEVSRLAETGFGHGRAGMLYRDLLPSRQGGRFIASHIRVSESGPVADEVHFHTIRFQLIFCVAGWARLVYEGQGDAFVLAAGDCVLQPPAIRHRVLESSAGLEVVEVTCPAVHETWFDAELALPTAGSRHEFGGQRFVLHRAADARWCRWRADGFDFSDTGIAAATGGLVGAGVVRATAAATTDYAAHDGELQLWFVLAGEAEVLRPGCPPLPLVRADAVAVPAGVEHALTTGEAGCELLEVAVPSKG
jgi:mannose-6-phosphate isomerase-like protein (cupin superfamily)